MALQGVGVDRRAVESGVAVEDDRDGHVAQQPVERLFGVERGDEGRRLERRQDLGGDAAADVDAASGQAGEGEVTRRRAERRRRSPNRMTGIAWDEMGLNGIS